MKKVLSVFLVCLLIISIVPVQSLAGNQVPDSDIAHEDDTGQWYASFSESRTCALTNPFPFGENPTSFEIPDKLTYQNNEYTVTEIQSSATNLNYPSSLRRIVIPSSVIAFHPQLFTYLDSDSNLNLGSDETFVIDYQTSSAVGKTHLTGSNLFGSLRTLIKFTDGSAGLFDCGETSNDLIYWELNSTGIDSTEKMTITQIGTALSLSPIPSSFIKYVEDNQIAISELSFSDSITAIPANFLNGLSVGSVKVHPGITTIGDEAFNGASKVVLAERDNYDFSGLSFGTNVFADVSVIDYGGIDVYWDDLKPSDLPSDTEVTYHYCQVTFNPLTYGEFPTDSIYRSPVIIRNGESIEDPSDQLIVADGYTVSFWYKDTTEIPYDFASAVTSSMILYAKGDELKKNPISWNNDDIYPNRLVVSINNNELNADYAEAYVGQTVTVDPRPQTGYQLDDLKVVNHDTQKEIEVVNKQFTMPDSPVTITATFSMNTYSVEFAQDYSSYGTFTATPEEGTYGTTVNLNAEVDPELHWFVSQWQIIRTDTDSSVQLNEDGHSFKLPASDVVITIKFDYENTYAITIDNDDEKGTIINAPRSAYRGDKVSLTVTPAENYMLASLSYTKKSDPSGEVYTISGNTFVMPDDNIILTTVYEKKKDTFIWLDIDGKELDRKVIEAGDSLPETDVRPTKQSDSEYTYEFSKWEIKSEVKSNSGTTTTYVPVFSKQTLPQYSISVSNDSHGLAYASAKSAVEGTVITLTVTPLTGYVFDRFDVLEGGVVIYGSSFTMGHANVRIRATFRKVQTVYVNFNAGGGTGSMPRVSVETGTDYTLPKCTYTAPEGKEFFCWKVGDKTFLAGDSIPIDSEITATAVWKDKSEANKTSYTVTFLTDSETTAAVQNVAEGGKVVRPTDPVKEGYIFVGWYTDTTYTTPFSFDTLITSNMTLHAKWREKAESDESVEYSITEGAGQKWTKNTSDTISIRAKRNIDDDTTLNHFVSLQIDGKALVKDVDYTVQSGSVIAVLKPGVMETLGNGIHRITFVFDDGKAETTLTIVAAAEEGGSKSSSSSSTSGTSSTSNPSTGDLVNSPFLWFGGMMLVMFILRLFIKARRQRIQEALEMQNQKS